MVTCPICGREFEIPKRRGQVQKYCSKACYRIANKRDNIINKRKVREAGRREWARHEAEWLKDNVATLSVDDLAELVYNRYRPKRAK